MGASDRPVSEWKGRTIDLFDAKFIKSNCCSDDIDYCVYRAGLVKMCNMLSVNAGFSVIKTVKYLFAQSLDALLQRAVVYYLIDLFDRSFIFGFLDDNV